MTKRSKKNQSPAPAASNEPAADTVTIEAIETDAAQTDTPAETVSEDVTAEPVVAEDVLAALAGADDDDAPAAIADEDVEVEDPTDDEVLATILGSKSSGRKSGTSTPKPTVVLREFTAVAQIDEATLKANLDGCNAKKVREKADNLIAAVQSGKKLSRYTKVAVEQLVANGAISGKDMVAAFLGAGLKEGTARAQAQQMTALFRLVGAVAPDPAVKGRLVANDAGLIAELEKLAA